MMVWFAAVFIFCLRLGGILGLPRQNVRALMDAAKSAIVSSLERKQDRDIATFVTMRAGRNIGEDLFWHYRGRLVSVNTGNIIAAVEGIERISPSQSLPRTMSLIRSNSTDFRMGYFSDKIFIYTESGE